MSTTSTRLISFIAALFVGSATAAIGQDPVQVTGRVVDEDSDEALSGTAVELLDWRSAVIARTFTNDDGTFQLVLPGGGEYRFRASRIGYRRATTPVLRTEELLAVEVVIRLDPEAVLLAPLEVTGWARRTKPSPVLQGFRDRMRTGFGTYFTRDDIERRKPGLVTDVLASVPGLQLRSSGRGMHREIFFDRRGDYCPAQIFIDGFLLNGRSRMTASQAFTLDEAVNPAVVEGIEVYRGLSSMPAEFLNPDSRCGAVVVWTRRGG